jgi:hypothetical protein
MTGSDLDIAQIIVPAYARTDSTDQEALVALACVQPEIRKGNRPKMPGKLHVDLIWSI